VRGAFATIGFDFDIDGITLGDFCECKFEDAVLQESRRLSRIYFFHRQSFQLSAKFPSLWGRAARKHAPIRPAYCTVSTEQRARSQRSRDDAEQASSKPAHSSHPSNRRSAPQLSASLSGNRFGITLA
jgi:hypothetical protein